MKFTNIQRIEFLLEEIQGILQSMKQAKAEEDRHTQRTPDVYQLLSSVPHAEYSSGTNSEDLLSVSTNSRLDGSSADEKEIPELCVRCLNSLEANIKAGQFEVPGCEWEEGRGRKKCRYCSSCRSECVKIPTAIRKSILRQKAELERAIAEGNADEIIKQQKRMSEVYFATHGRVRGTLSSEERQRRRQRAAIQREEKRKREISRSMSGDHVP